MTGKQLTKAERAVLRATDRAMRQTRWIEIERPRLRAAVRSEVERRGLASFMNATRWRALRDAVLDELPFPPAFQLQDVLGPRETPWGGEQIDGIGAWTDEDLEPLFSIEWMRVVPRYRVFVGALVSGPVVDCTDQFRNLLSRLHIPFREDAARTFWIYGYAPADPATLTWDPEKPT